MRYYTRLLASTTACAAAILCALAPSQAAAQANDGTSNPDAIADIVVTAQKREENLQKVPISVTAIGGEALAARGLTSIVQLAGAVPGLKFQSQAGILLPFLRGVGSSSSTVGNESSVAVYSDGVYFARLPSVMFELNNVERVEILKGPQGTLFGRNSTGGIINIVTKDPSHNTAIKGSLGYGRFDAVNANVYATTGLGDKAAIDFSAYGETDQGFGRNLAIGKRYGYQDSFFARSKLLFEPSDSTTIRLTGYYSWAHQSGQKAPYPGTTTGTISAPHEVFTSDEVGFYNSISDPEEYNVFKTWGISLRADHDLSFARITSISAYSNLKEFDSFDGDHASRRDFYVPIHASVKLFTQELQLSSLPGSALN